MCMYYNVVFEIFTHSNGENATQRWYCMRLCLSVWISWNLQWPIILAVQQMVICRLTEIITTLLLMIWVSEHSISVWQAQVCFFISSSFSLCCQCACACVNNLWWFDYSMWLIWYWSCSGIKTRTLSSPLLCAFPSTFMLSEFMLINNAFGKCENSSAKLKFYSCPMRDLCFMDSKIKWFELWVNKYVWCALRRERFCSWNIVKP